MLSGFTGLVLALFLFGIGVGALDCVSGVGVLTGPAGIGFVASASSLPISLLLLAGMLILVAATAPWVRM